MTMPNGDHTTTGDDATADDDAAVPAGGSPPAGRAPTPGADEPSSADSVERAPTPATPPGGDLGVRLTWPGAEEQAGASRADLRSDGPDAAPDSPSAEVQAADGDLDLGVGSDDATDDTDRYAGSMPTSAGGLTATSLRPMSLVPEASGRPDTVQGALDALAMRVEALITGVAAMRGALSSRLNDHTDTIGRLVRSQANDLEEHQRDADRSMEKLTRTAGDTDDAVRRIASRMEDLGAGVAEMSRLLESTTEEGHRLALASDKLSRQVTDGLETFGDRLLDRLDELDMSLATDLGVGRTDVAQVRKLLSGGGTGVRAGADLVSDHELRGLRDELGGLAAILPDEESIRDLLDDAAARISESQAGALAALRAEVQAVVADRGASGATEAASPADVAELRDALKDLPAIRAALGTVSEQQAQLADAAEGLLQLRDAIELVPLDEPGSATDGVDDASPDVGAELASLREVIEASGSNRGITGLRKDVAELRTLLERRPTRTVASAPDGAAAVDGDELEALRAEIAALRRRMSVKAKPAPVTLDDKQLARLADEVSARLRQILDPAPDDRG